MATMFVVDNHIRFGRSSQIVHIRAAFCPSAQHGRIQVPWVDEASTVNEIGDSMFHKGQPVWVIQSDGSQRAAEYVGEGEMSAWFGGAPTVIVVYPDTHSGGAVEVDRVIARHA